MYPLSIMERDLAGWHFDWDYLSSVDNMLSHVFVREKLLKLLYDWSQQGMDITGHLRLNMVLITLNWDSLRAVIINGNCVARF